MKKLNNCALAICLIYCFLQITSAADIHPAIVGGLNALPNEFPYQVSLRENGKLWCGGTILSSFFILTASHCVIESDKNGRTSTLPTENLTVVAGDHTISKDEETEQIRRIVEIFTHSQYNFPTRLNNDIAILKMDQGLQLNAFVQPIPWPKKPTKFKGNAIATGWGRTEWRAEISDVLQTVTLKLRSKEECQSYYANRSAPVTDTMLCAGGGGRDSCQGDSGGPLVCKDGSKSILCGIVSYGFRCGYEDFPGVYTDVSKFSDWIAETIKSAPTSPEEESVNLYNTPLSLQATTECCKNTYIGVKKDAAWIIDYNEIILSQLEKNATFRLVPGLAKSELYSIESLSYPGHYLRHANWRIYLNPEDGSQLMKEDATFYVRPGAKYGEVRFESYNYPGSFIRHYNGELYIANQKPEFRHLNHNAAWVFLEDTIWRITTPVKSWLG